MSVPIYVRAHACPFCDLIIDIGSVESNGEIFSASKWISKPIKDEKSQLMRL
jgi:hypothetical protein